MSAVLALFPWRRNVVFGGAGRVAGTVHERPDGALPGEEVPVRRRVRLVDEKSGLLVAETWSEAVSGAFCFPRVAMERRYTVLSYDHDNVFRAVVADRVLAVKEIS